MADPNSKSRNVLEPLGLFDAPNPSLSSFTTLTVSAFSDSQTLIYAGTRSGNLLLLSVNPRPYPSPADLDLSLPRNVSLLRSVSLGGSPVESLLVIGDVGKVLALSGGFLFLIDSLLLHPAKRLSFVKGVSVVAPRLRSGLAEISDLWVSDCGKQSEFSRPGQRLLQKLGGGVRTNAVKTRESEPRRDGNYVYAMVVGKRLVLAEFVVGNETGRNRDNVDSVGGLFLIIKEIQCFDGIKTMVWVDDSIIAGTSDGYSLISCVTGEDAFIFKLPEPSTLPRIKMLLKDCKVLLLVDNVGVTVDIHGQPVGGSLVFCCHPDSIEEISSYVIIVGNGRMELYHKKSGNRVQLLSFSGEEVGQCVVGVEGVSGELVAVATPSKVICYRKVQSEEQIKDLLRKKNFREAISLVEELESEGEMTKDMLSFCHAQVGFLLVFELQFEEAVNHFLRSETMQPSEVFPFIMRDPNRWSLLVPRNRYWGLHPPPVPLEDVVDDGLMAIQRAIFLKKAGVESAVDNDFLVNPPNRADLLESAIKSFIRYLEVSREKELTSSVKEGVDTLLMYLYRALNRVCDMEKLASSVNSCVVEELETLLDDSGHLRTLAFLYASKGMSSKALAIWRILARNYSSGLWKDTLVGSEPQFTSGKDAAAIEASKILEESSNEELILQHLGWVADINQLLAIQILTSEKRSNLLSPDEVIASIDPQKVDILQRYLQWLIEDQDSDDTQFHTLYTLSLAKSAIDASELVDISPKHGGGKLDESTNLSSGNIFQSPVRDRLQMFLQSSDLYDPEEILNLIEESELWLEKAILYRKLGQETLVLQILALKLEDSEAAEQYCTEIGRSDAYMQLLDMYVDPQDGKEPMFKAAVRLLHNHGESLDPLRVLEALSPDMPLELASETIQRILRARVHHLRQGQIKHNLSRAVDVDAKLARLDERSRHVQINDESLCDSCHARLGTKLFAMYPDDSIVCYKCFRRQGESTSVTGRNFKRDILFKPGWLVSG